MIIGSWEPMYITDYSHIDKNWKFKNEPQEKKIPNWRLDLDSKN
jgi:hypothetical protein